MADVSVEQVNKEIKRVKKSDKHSDLLTIHPEMQSLLSLATRQDIGKMLQGKTALKAGQEQKQLSKTNKNLDILLRFMEIYPMFSGKKAPKTS